jgi:fluoride ion exporter CrcB/FEX
VLLGPAGCTARWLLSQYNYRLPGGWRWLPAGTLAANLLGCLTDFVVGVRGRAPRMPASLRCALLRADRACACLPERLRGVRRIPLLAT